MWWLPEFPSSMITIFLIAGLFRTPHGNSTNKARWSESQIVSYYKDSHQSYFLEILRISAPVLRIDHVPEEKNTRRCLTILDFIWIIQILFYSALLTFDYTDC